jgi:VIT1/CCC1 family predicted Fe2+/Mn2+ transporter
MADEETTSRTPVLDPSERISEVLFGLIMVLTFTGSLSVAEAGREDVRTMLVGAIGCNLAWGVIDGLFYLMGRLAEMGADLRTLRGVRAARDAATARRRIARTLPPLVADHLRPEEFEALHARLSALPEPPEHLRLTRRDWLAAFIVFLLVFLSTLPVALPFAFIDDAPVAKRVSNAIAIGALFFTGFAYGRLIGRSSWLIGIGMVLWGAALVAFTIALGG